jgi:hypothetical protein
MAGALAQPTRRFDSERERLRRRRDRHARLATDRAVAEVAFRLRARDRPERVATSGRPRARSVTSCTAEGLASA